MDNFTEILRELHTNLLRIRSISEEIQSGPRRLHRLQARIAAAVKAVTDHQAALKANKVAIHEREISVKANVEKINKHKRDLNTATAKKEFDALNVEIAVLEKRNRDLEDQILDLMGQADDLAAKTPALEAAAAKANEEFDQAEAEYKSQVAGWQVRLEEARNSAKEKSELLPPDWLKEFRRLEPTEGPDALSPLTGRSCSSCYTEVTAQQFAILRAGQISACKNCGKILFLAD